MSIKSSPIFIVYSHYAHIDIVYSINISSFFQKFLAIGEDKILCFFIVGYVFLDGQNRMLIISKRIHNTPTALQEYCITGN